MILAYHVIFTAYGFWLPNDPRGSWSDFVRSWELFRFGPATHTHSRRSTAGEQPDHGRRQAAKEALLFPPVTFTGVQCRSIAEGFKRHITRSGLRVMACSILPQHVHMVVGRHRYKVESVMNQLKGEATRALDTAGLHPLAGLPRRDRPMRVDEATPSPWTAKGWNVFLNSEADIFRACQYVIENPMKEGLPRQRWKFVDEPFGLERLG